MAIKPIDLQTLFSKLEQVNKEQTLLKEQNQAGQLMHTGEVVAKTVHKDQTVNAPQEQSEQAKSVSDQDHANNFNEEKKQNKKNKDSDKKKEYFSDPELGSKIDISG